MPERPFDVADPNEASTPRLVVVDGPHPVQPQTIGPRLTIGRSERCDLVLAGPLVSRTHAEVTLADDGFVIRDLGSHNGTFVNGSLVTRVELRHGDQIRVGEYTLQTELPGPKDDTASTDSHVVLGTGSETADHRISLHGEPRALQDSLISTDETRAERARRRLDALVGIGQNLARLRELEELYPLIVDEVRRILPAERAVLLRVTPEGELQPKVARDSKAPGSQVNVSRTILDDVCRQRVCVLTEDAMVDEQYRSSESIRLSTIRSVLCVPIEYDKQLLGVLYLDDPHREGLFVEEDLHFVSGVASVAAVAITNAMALDNARATGQELNHTYLSMLAVLANAIEARDHYTIGHTWRVARFSQIIARRLGWGEEKLAEIEVGGMLHDIGKIGVPDSILTKSGPLDDQEQRSMELHPQIGARMLRDVPSLRRVIPYVLHHHERFDGTGYPDRLNAETIPIEARLLSVADALDAMTSNRPYRSGLGHDVALAEIHDRAGSQFDPEVVEALAGAYRAGELTPYLQVGLHSERDVICPHCSTCCTPESAAVERGETTCPTCKRRMALQPEGSGVRADLL